MCRMSSQDQTTANQSVTPQRDERLATHDILETAAADGSFGEFLAAVRASGSESFLRGAELITVFMPTNEAFAAYAGPSRNSDNLGELVRSHVMQGAWTVEDLSKSASLKTLTGAQLPIEKEGRRFA